MEISNLWKVLKKGEVLENSEFWKKAQNFINLISGCSGVIILLLPQTKELLTPENIVSFTVAISALNSYFNVATTDKIGIGNPDKI